MEKPNVINESLSQFHGSDTIYKYSIGSKYFHHTEGVLFLADSCHCFWLLDCVLSYQGSSYLEGEDFQVWKFQRFEDKWLLSCSDGDGSLLVDQDISFSDFPLNEITLWCVGGTLLLPSEY